MLILTRRVDETLVIGDDVTVKVLGVKGNQVRVGISAPGEINIVREELIEQRGASLSEDIEFLRKRQQNLMPDFMKDFSVELSQIERPDEYTLSKTDYITAWITILGRDLLDGEGNANYYINQFMQFNILQLKTAFDWTIQHFAELDMGGNCKWLGVALHILKQLKNDEWSVTQQNNLIAEYITDTRWYDY